MGLNDFSFELPACCLSTLQRRLSPRLQAEVALASRSNQCQKAQTPTSTRPGADEDASCSALCYNSVRGIALLANASFSNLNRMTQNDDIIRKYDQCKALI